MKDCLKCENLDTSDIPNLFCKLNCELVNKTEFRYCPKDPKSVVEFIEKLEELHKQEIKEIKENNRSKLVELFDAENKKLQQQLKEKDEENVFLKEENKKLYKRIEKIIQDYEKQQLSSIDAYQRVILRLRKKLKDNTKQVCEKIKEELGDKFIFFDGKKEYYKIQDVAQILNKIGAGEI